MTTRFSTDGALGAGDIAERLATRRNYQQEVRRLVASYPVVVFYGCGLMLSSIIETWDEYVGRQVDFCCDSDPDKWGKSFAGIPCVSPDQLLAMRDRCVVFLTVGQFKPVYDFLTRNGVASVNIIYKYDLLSSEFLATHEDREIAEDLAAARALMADERSRMVFDAILERMLAGEHDPGLMSSVCEPDQYFPADIVQLTDHESFVDIGAFDGDTARDFADRTGGQFARITCFEIDRINFEALRETVGQMPCADRITIHNLGIWDSECDITYSIDRFQSTVGDGEGKGHVVALDDVLGNSPVSYIKMDIEGAEPRALIGARRIIQAQKPRLAICAYHHIRHLWEIPLAIHELVPEYRIYLRHHTNLEYETVCYAVC